MIHVYGSSGGFKQYLCCCSFLFVVAVVVVFYVCSKCLGKNGNSNTENVNLWKLITIWSIHCISHVALHFFSLNFVVTPHTRCRLKLLKLERIKDFLLMEEELIQNQEILKPQEQKNEVCNFITWVIGKTQSNELITISDLFFIPDLFFLNLVKQKAEPVFFYFVCAFFILLLQLQLNIMKLLF